MSPSGSTASDSIESTCWPAVMYATSVSVATCAASTGTSTKSPS